MPVMTKDHHKKLTYELSARIGYLIDSFAPRELKSSSEGSKRGSWIYHEKMCATIKSSLELRLAVDDFKTILAEIRKLK